MEPFKVEITLATPMLASAPIMLDSILAWCAVQEAGGDWAAGDSLPLEKREANGHSYWAASRFWYHWTPAYQTHMSKRIPHSALERYSDSNVQLQPGSGINKTYHDILSPIHVEKAIAFGVGDVDEVDYLLRRILHFGKNVRAGYGRVKNIVAEPFEHDWSEEIDGSLMRNIPASIETAHGMGAFRAPYWDKTKWDSVMFASTKMPILINKELKK